MADKTAKTSFQGSPIGTVLPKGAKLKKDANGRVTVVYPKKTTKKKRG